MRDGYDLGKYSKGQCSCEDQKQDYDDFIHKRLTIGPQPDVPFKSDNKGKGQSLEVYLPDDWNL